MNAMTLQDILAMQAARQRAYEADLDDMVRYGKGALFTSTVIVDLYKMFDQKEENLTGLRLEIPAEVTLGQLEQLLGEVTQEQFSDAFFLEQLQPYYDETFAAAVERRVLTNKALELLRGAADVTVREV